MRQVGEVGQPVVEVAPPSEVHEEFEIWLSTRDGVRLDGYVLHRRSGRRESVGGWEDVADRLTRLLENANDSGDGE